MIAFARTYIVPTSVKKSFLLNLCVCRLLAPNSELSDLIRDMGVESVTHAGVVARFVLPELGAVHPEDRRQLLQHIRMHWAELKTDESLVTSLKHVKIRLYSSFKQVPSSNSL